MNGEWDKGATASAGTANTEGFENAVLAIGLLKM